MERTDDPSKKRKMEGTTSFDDLQIESKLDIFSRLPLELVLGCRKVCKPWKDILHFQNNTITAFAHQHLLRQRRRLKRRPLDDDDINSHDGSDISNMSVVILNGDNLYYGEYFDNYGGDYIGYNSRKINLKFPSDVCGFVGSCNGLVCLSVALKFSPIKFLSKSGESDEPLYICNPVTREMVTLPALYIGNKKNKVSVAHGFGYHPVTKEYKVVRIWYGSIGSKSGVSGQVEVYTVGSGRGWRNAGKIDYYVVPNDENRNNCVNGSLHWLKYETGEIVAFDLADEKFHFVHTPPGLSPSVLSSKISVMRGCLCLAYEYAKGTDLWMLKKSNEKNAAGSSNICNAKDQYYQSRSWIKESHIALSSSLMSRLLKIVGLTEESKVVLRDTNSSSLSQYSKGGLKPYMPDSNGGAFYYRIISHVNSFVSLKALGEANVQTRKGLTDSKEEVARKYVPVPGYIVEDFYSLL